MSQNKASLPVKMDNIPGKWRYTDLSLFCVITICTIFFSWTWAVEPTPVEISHNSLLIAAGLCLVLWIMYGLITLESVITKLFCYAVLVGCTIFFVWQSWEILKIRPDLTRIVGFFILGAIISIVLLLHNLWKYFNSSSNFFYQLALDCILLTCLSFFLWFVWETYHIAPKVAIAIGMVATIFVIPICCVSYKIFYYLILLASAVLFVWQARAGCLQEGLTTITLCCLGFVICMISIVNHHNRRHFIASIKLSKHSLESLRKNGVPGDMLDTLALLGRVSEKNFWNRVNRCIGDNEHAAEWKRVILQHTQKDKGDDVASSHIGNLFYYFSFTVLMVLMIVLGMFLDPAENIVTAWLYHKIFLLCPILIIHRSYKTEAAHYYISDSRIDITECRNTLRVMTDGGEWRRLIWNRSQISRSLLDQIFRIGTIHLAFDDRGRIKQLKLKNIKNVDKHYYDIHDYAEEHKIEERVYRNEPLYYPGRETPSHASIADNYAYYTHYKEEWN